LKTRHVIADMETRGGVNKTKIRRLARAEGTSAFRYLAMWVQINYPVSRYIAEEVADHYIPRPKKRGPKKVND
jgi:hypothetical protein